MPRLSTMLAMVEAVPMVMQWPGERDIPDSALMKSASVISPAFTASLNCQTEVPEPTSQPRNLPFSIGPPLSAMVGRSQLAAPISSAGVVLSQPTSSTTPSIGLARIDSSTSMLARLRNSIAVGRSVVSPRDIAGNSTGKPPASYTPRFTTSASSLKCALHGLRSDQVLQMPITGRPSNMWSGWPWFLIQLRCMKASLLAPPYQCRDLSCFLPSVPSAIVGTPIYVPCAAAWWRQRALPGHEAWPEFVRCPLALPAAA